MFFKLDYQISSNRRIGSREHVFALEQTYSSRRLMYEPKHQAWLIYRWQLIEV
jgi:hypothetical protein